MSKWHCCDRPLFVCCTVINLPSSPHTAVPPAAKPSSPPLPEHHPGSTDSADRWRPQSAHKYDVSNGQPHGIRFTRSNLRSVPNQIAEFFEQVQRRNFDNCFISSAMCSSMQVSSLPRPRSTPSSSSTCLGTSTILGITSFTFT